jgi:serine/threonine-protein kinase
MLGFGTKAKVDSEGRRLPGPFGRFYLRELINSGGMADLWLATDEHHMTCAIRCLRGAARFDFAARRRFQRGCEILAAVHDHESIIGYIEHGKIEGTWYVALEYVEGANLKVLMGHNDPQLEEFAGNVLIDSAQALEHVHDRGFMHLDFKPENIVVTRNGSVRLVDFDLARPRPEFPEKLPENPGTPAYMAPEQLQREPVDHRADIFAFGVTAYELLTFRKPFPGDSPAEILARQLDRSLDFVPPREINEAIPLALERIILKCLETDPSRRYPFMSVVVRDLQSVLYV